MEDYSLTATFIEQAHTILGHYSAQKMANYICLLYWWPRLGHEVDKYCMMCCIFQVNKTSTQWPVGLLHTLPIPNRPWGSIGMYFIGPFPRSEGFDYLWIVICRLTSMVHLIPVNIMTKASELVSLYVKDVAHLHGLPDSIVSNRDSKFMSMFWGESHQILGTKLLMSTSFHPQIDGVSKRVNRSVGQILQTLILLNQSDWVDKLPLTEFTPFELNYGYMPSW
jgi:hypothetical protein